MIKGSDIGIQEKKAKLFNEWERFTSNDGESIESYYHRFLKLMNDLKRNKHFPEKIASNLKFLNSMQPEWSRHVTIVHLTRGLHIADYTQLYDFLKYNEKEVDELKVKRLAKTQDPLALMATFNNPYTFPVLHQDQPSFNQNYMQQPMQNPKDITDLTIVMNIALALMAKAFKLNYSTPTNNNQRISSNLCNRQIAQPGNLNGYNDVQNVGNQVIQHAVQNPRIQNVIPGNANHNLNGNGNLVAERAEGNATGIMTQLLIAQKEEAGIQLHAKEFDLMATAADLDEIKEVNANCILMVNLQQASTSGTQTDKAPVYDLDRSSEVHNYEDCYDNDIFNMFTQDEQYTELLEPITESHQEPHNDNNVILSKTSRDKKQKGNVSINEKQKKQQPKVKKTKKVGFIKRLATPKPSKPRSFLRWSPTGRLFDLKGKIIASSESESQFDCSKGDNACTSNPQEPKIKWFPNSTFSLADNPTMLMVRRLGLFQAYDRESKASHKFHLEVFGNKRYPLIKEMLQKMWNWKLKAKAKSTMAFELLKFIKSQLEE
uniref:Gag-Pol polyprotein n=1 Tax=Tanacetum cinerariifolium TaxID=118510 RepID=A0A6L2KM18_TANCI|nr:hypothetical protein [Tanacetum cinerariifolium]